MYVYERMNKNPIFARESDKISGFSKIPCDSRENICVVDDDGIFRGIIDRNKNGDIINCIPKNTRAIEITETGFKINQDMLIEEAAFIMKENRLDFLPVVDNNDILVGTITKTKIFSTFMKMLSINGEGTRLVLSAENDGDVIPAVVHTAENSGCRINSISAYANSGNEIILSYSASKNDDLSFIEAIEKTDGLKIKSVKRFSWIL